MDPSNKGGPYGKALIFYSQQKYDDAIEYYNKVLGIDPTFIDAINGKAFSLASLSKNE